MTVSILVGLLFLLVVGVGIVLAVRAVRRPGKEDDNGGLDLIPYLLLALAVGAAGFSLAALARASLTPDRLIGRPTAEIAGALAGLVVAGPIAFFLWRRQARRRRAFPGTPGWPVYLAIIELVFLTAFFVAIGQLGEMLGGSESGVDWTDLLIYGGIVAFHWWAERKERPAGDIGELPRLVGSGVALIALTIGLVGVLDWLFSLVYEGLWGLAEVPAPEVPLVLTIAAAPVWASRWLPAWDEETNLLRSFYLGFVAALTLTMAIGAAVALIATLLTFLLGQAGSSSEHFRNYPMAFALLVVGWALWRHHRLRMGEGRAGGRRGYEYAMAAAGLAILVGSATALVDAAFTPALAGTNRGAPLIALGCTVIASGWVWLNFWRKAQSAPREQETRALPRRVYLIGMAIILGLTAAGSLIAVLVVVFRALLGEVEAGSDNLRVPVTLTLTSGLATWHLFNQIRADGALRERSGVKPFSVTVVCSHPGMLSTMFPKEATVRVLYRGDDAGVIDDEMASAIITAVDGKSSLVWVDQGGFRVAAARD